MFRFLNCGAVEDSAVTVRARLVDGDGNLFEAADIDTIEYSVYKVVAGVATIDSEEIDPADVFVTPATSADDSEVWNGKRAYNFKHVVPGTAFPLGGLEYQIEYTITPVGAEPIQTMPIRIPVTERMAG